MSLEIQRVSHVYAHGDSRVAALQDVDCQVAAGEFVAVTGPSGSGKSTLLLIAGGLLAPTEGRVRIGQSDLYELPESQRAERRSRDIGFVFQQFQLIDYLTVFENVLAAAAPENDQPSKRASDWLRRLGVADRLAHRPKQLSSGEKQRVALARAMINTPRVVLADEPTGNLDEANRRVVADVLRGSAEDGAAVLLVTHDDELAGAADRVLEIDHGKIAERKAIAPLTMH